MTLAASRSTGYVARLHWNESPLGPPPRAVERIIAQAAEIHHYPVDLRAEATVALAEYLGVAVGEVLLTCGVDEATDLVLADAKRLWHVVPGFTGYLERARAGRVAFREIRLDERLLPVTVHSEPQPGDTVIIAQPHNPTGNMFPRAWPEAVLDTGADLVIDETYADFADTSPHFPDFPARPTHPRLLRFRSLSKSWGLAGLRIGVLVGPPERIAALATRQCFHSVDSVALHGLLGALEQPEWVAEHVQYVCAMREEFRAMAEESPVFDAVLRTQTNFVLARCAASHPADRLCRELARRRVRLYDCAAVGMAGWVRISVGTGQDLRLLRNTLHQI